MDYTEFFLPCVYFYVRVLDIAFLKSECHRRRGCLTAGVG